MKTPAKKGPGQPKKPPTTVTYVRLQTKENALLEKEVRRTGRSKASIIQSAVRRYYGITEEL